MGPWKTNKTLKAENTELSAQLETFKAENAELKAAPDTAALTATNTELQTMLTEATEENAALSAQVVDLEAKVKAIPAKASEEARRIVAATGTPAVPESKDGGQGGDIGDLKSLQTKLAACSDPAERFNLTTQLIKLDQ